MNKRSIEEMLEKDLRDFFFKETDIFNKRGIGENFVRLLIYGLTAKRGNKEFGLYRNIAKPLKKVKDLYTLSQEEMYTTRKAGEKTWQRINSYLKKMGLPPLQLSEEY
jgi:hypothetical protein